MVSFMRNSVDDVSNWFLFNNYSNFPSICRNINSVHALKDLMGLSTAFLFLETEYFWQAVVRENENRSNLIVVHILC
jgi:hypothetical protein